MTRVLHRESKQTGRSFELSDEYDVPENVLVREWFPQSAILAHNKTVLYFGHGGLNGLNEAIKYRKPMLAMPIWSDGWDTTNR